MNKLCIVFLAIILISASSIKVHAQAFCVGAGIGTYAMSDIKDYIENEKRYLPVVPKTFNNFPPYFNYHFGLRFYNFSGTLYYEPEFAYFSTGLRLNYSDYSGEINTDFIMTAYMMGFETGTFFSTNKKVKSGMYQQVSFYYTHFQIEDMIRIGNETETSSSALNITHLALEGGLFADYSISEKLSAFSSLGYSQQLVTFEKLNHKPDWSGLRFELGLIFKTRLTN